jgi:hypothetical protein
MEELRSVGKTELATIADLMHVQALCRDAMHVLPEVLYTSGRHASSCFARMSAAG